MISPDDIRRKAANLYPAFIRAWLAGEPFFPCIIRANKSLGADDPAGSISAIQSLRANSKAATGTGYSIEWVERASRGHGKNLFPHRIVIESETDFLSLIGKQRDFIRFSQAAGVLRAEFPDLNQWIASHPAKLTEIADSVEGLVSVMRYFKSFPRPGLFARELPLPVHTKFIEWHQSILREWFDLILPPASIDASETHFERRYGLRIVQPHLLVRVLDRELLGILAWPFEELSLPLDTLACLHLTKLKVFIVENKVNALTLPPMRFAMTLGGLGDGVINLRRLSWLHECEVIYWGDLDAEGYEALSSLRSHVPNTRTMLMDAATLNRWRILAGEGTGQKEAKSLHLTAEEMEAYLQCCAGNVRLEQERLPQSAVIAALASLDETESHE